MRIFRAFAIFGFLFFVGSFLLVAFQRLNFPFDIEWMEGGMLTHAVRIKHGLPIYGPPSTEFVPFFYTPGYAYVVSMFSVFTDDITFGLGRTVSLTATLLTLGLLYWVVKRESSGFYGVFAAGLYAALFRTNGAFYDLARPDALVIFLILLGTTIAYYGQRARWACAAGIILACAFLTKQTASVFVPAITLCLAFRCWRSAAAFSVSAVGVAAIVCVVLNQQTDGWFWTYIFEGHQGHVFIWENILLEYWRDLIFLCPITLLLSLLWFSYRVPILGLSIILAGHWSYAFVARALSLDYVPHMYYRELFYENPRWLILLPPMIMGLLCVLFRFRVRGKVNFQTSWFWLVMFVAGVGASGLNHSTQWAYSNCFMLISLFAAILVPLAVRDLLAGFAEHHALRLWSVSGIVGVGFVALWYSPTAQVPGDGDREGLQRLHALTADLEGPLLVPAHPLYSYQRDGHLHLHQMGVGDVAYRGGIKDLQGRLAEHTWGAVVLDERQRLPGLQRSYYPAFSLRFANAGDLRSKTGFLVRPATVWLPQTTLPTKIGGRVSANFEDGQTHGWNFQGKADESLAYVATGGRKGQQGKRYLSTTSPGVGRLMSESIRVEGRRLSFLVGGSDAKQMIRIRQADKVIARLRPPVSGHVRLVRRSIDLSDYLGQSVQIELVDRTKTGQLWLDDLRWVKY